MNESKQPRPTARTAPLTAIQQYWLHAMKEGKLDNPVVSTVARLVPCRLDLDRFARALRRVTHRHEPLRTRIVEICGETMQVIDADFRINLKVQSFAHLEAAPAREHARHGIALFATAQRDIARDHGFGATVFDLGDVGQVIALYLDHIFSDPVSMDILWADLAEMYAIGEAETETSLRLQLADYALMECSLTEGDRNRQQSRHFATICDIAFPQLSERHRPDPPQGYDMHVIPFEIGRDTIDAISHRVHDLATTLPIFLFGAFAVATARWANRATLVACMPLTLRREVELEDVVGFLSTNCPLRVILAVESLDAFFERLTGNILEAHECATAPAEFFAGSRNPSFDEICFNFVPKERRSDLDKFGPTSDFAHEIPTRRHFSALMAVLLERDDRSLQGYLAHNCALFSPTTISVLLDDFLATVLRWTVQDRV